MLYRIQVLRVASLSFLLCLVSVACTDKTLITQAFRGRAFGSPNSDDVARRIVVDSEGTMFVAGVTTPTDRNQDPWGLVEAGEMTGGRDIFVAKFLPSGDLGWVTRTGSSERDELNDLKLANGALYVCGSTYGEFGGPLNGSADAFIMKFYLEGTKAWMRPFQFGSEGVDVCNGIAVDEVTGLLYAVGNTDGALFTDKSVKETVQPFIVKLEEVLDFDNGLEIKLGYQEDSFHTRSAEQIFIANKSLIVLGRSWQSIIMTSENTTTYVQKVASETLAITKTHLLSLGSARGFNGKRMMVSNLSSEVFVVGEALTENFQTAYYAVGFSLATGTRLWEHFLGAKVTGFHRRNQQAAITASWKRGVVSVAGTDDGIYFANRSMSQGLAVVPFFELNMTTGGRLRRWHRVTKVPEDQQQVTDVAECEDGSVVFTGAWTTGLPFSDHVWMGAFRSSKQSSMGDGMPPISSENLENAEEEKTRESGKRKVMLFVVGCLSFAAVVMLLLLLCKCRKSGRRVSLDVDDLDVVLGQMQAEGQPKKVPYKQENNLKGTSTEGIGGSASPR